MDVKQHLLAVLIRRLTAPAHEWLEDRLSAIEGGADALEGTFTAIGRRTGRAPLALDAGEVRTLANAGLDWPIAHWGADELGRVLWLIAATSRLPAERRLELVARSYDDGDNRERQAVLRALPLLEGAERYLPVAIESTRTHVLPIFEAIACENPYPARHFPDGNFNQLALKAAFVEVALARIVELGKRKTRELDRMARDYAAEREAAHRPVPKDLGLLMLET
jgi:hypothetical protein